MYLPSTCIRGALANSSMVYERISYIDQATTGGAAIGQKVEEVVERLENAACAPGGDDPLGRGVVEILYHHEHPNALPVPAKAVTEVCGHPLLIFFSRPWWGPEYQSTAVASPRPVDPGGVWGNRGKTKAAKFPRTLGEPPQKTLG